MGRTRVYGCGTPAGYHYHRLHDTPVCPECQEAIRVDRRENFRDRTRRQSERLADQTDRLGELSAPRAGQNPTADIDDDWRVEAPCWKAPPEWFHSGKGEDTMKGLALCAKCAFVKPCAQLREKLNAPGVWAGIVWGPRAQGVISPAGVA